MSDSIALVACRSGAGCVLQFSGVGVTACMEELGADIRDCGLDDAPDGLSIWEGRYTTERSCGDYVSYLDGKFRSLTNHEWDLFRSTGIPWVPVG